MENVHHETVYFSGHVQGVGFRFATMQVAREFDVSGFVRNLADRRVQLDIEGKSADVDAFVAYVEDRMHGFLRKTESSSETRPPQYHCFSIR